MRVPVLATALILSAAALAGCFGSDGEPQTPASSDDDGLLPGSETAPLKILSPLATAVTTTAAKWVQTGAQIDVAATAPANAKGNVSYVWAIGPLPGTLDVKAAADTKTIEPGKSASLKFSQAGVFRMHCHPHPAMKHNVTVVDGYKGATTVHVQIVDGAKLNEYRFVPENVVVGKDATIVYHNNGTQPHTATLESAEPALKKVDLSSASGKVAVDGTGWQRIVVTVMDGEGRIGFAQHDVYATAELPAAKTETFECSFAVGSQGQALPPETQPVTGGDCANKLQVAQGGTLFVNWTARDAAADAGGPGEANQATVEVHVRPQGEQQDAMTGAAAASGAVDGKVLAGAFDVVASALGGAGVKATLELTVVPDLVPPPPTKPAAGGDAHGGHAH